MHFFLYVGVEVAEDVASKLEWEETVVEVAGDVASKLEWEDWPVEVEAAVEGAEKVADVLGWDGDPGEFWKRVVRFRNKWPLQQKEWTNPKLTQKVTVEK